MAKVQFQVDDEVPPVVKVTLDACSDSVDILVDDDIIGRLEEDGTLRLFPLEVGTPLTMDSKGYIKVQKG